MLLMHLCRHSQAPLFLPQPHHHHHHHHHRYHHPTIPASSPPSPLFALLHFFPWSEFRSATALTHTHDETEWDTIWLTLTHTLGIEVFACTLAHTVGLPLMMMHTHTHKHNSRHMTPPPPLFINHSSPHSLMYLRLCQRSAWCKTPYIGIPAQVLWLKQPPIYSQPLFWRIREGRAGERGETKKEWAEAKIRGTVQRDMGQTVTQWKRWT